MEGGGGGGGEGGTTSRDMLISNFLWKGLGLASPAHFVYDWEICVW